MKGIKSAIVLFFLCSKEASAIGLYLGAHSGIMQQPTSNYFHGVSGGFVAIGTEKKELMSKIVYLARPKFESAGFVDEEQYLAAFLGHGFYKSKYLEILGYLGYGQVSGAIRTIDSSDSRKSSFSVQGMATSMEVNLNLGDVILGLAHETVNGLGTKRQTEAFVIWPYTFFLVSVGYAI